MPDPVLQNTLDVTIKGDLYVFRIPTFADEIKLGLREREIRRSMEVEMYGANYQATGMPTGDQGTEFLVRTAAQFEHLLEKGPRWVYTNGPGGVPVIDFRQWDKDKVDTIVEVGVAFGAELRRFRAGGTPDGQPPSIEAVAREPAPGAEPVRPDPPQS